MESEKLQKVVEQLLQRKLSQIEQKVLAFSWDGQSYKEIEDNTGYVIGYLRDIGSGLWKELSDVLKQRVTKKNLPLVLEKFQSDRTLIKSDEITADIDDFLENEDTITNYNSSLSFPSAPLPSNSLLYIQRPPLEKIARNEIARQGCLLRIKAPMRMGKSSLLNQVIAEANHLGYQLAYLDCKDIEEATYRSIDSLLHWFCATICQQLNLPSNLDHYWDEEMGSKISCKLLFEQYILEHTKQPLVIALNELNNIFEHPHTAIDFLALLRSFHEQSQRSATWHKLRIILVYSTDIYVPVKIDHSPFNVGLALKLPFFNNKQVLDLAQRYGLNWQSDRKVLEIMNLVNGHPYLVNIALYYLSQELLNFEQLIAQAHTPKGIYSQHLQRYFLALHQDPKLIAAMCQVIQENRGVRLDILLAYKLESMGLIIIDGFLARPSCELYRRYFSEVLTILQ